MPVVNPEHLLDQADRLAASSAGAPRQADLRRAISSAYYALFHRIAIEAADDFIGRSHRDSDRYTLLYRSIDHGPLRTLCQYARKVPPKNRDPDKMERDKYLPYLPPEGFDPEIRAFAATVVDLQERRNSADYDPRFRVSPSDAALTISIARAALSRFGNASRISRKAFLTLVVFSPRSK